MNDPTSELRLEYVETKSKLDALKKAIKQNPDQRYVQRKELGAELKGLKEAICERLDDDEEIMVGTRRFKKQRIEKVRYNKDGIHTFCSRHEMDPATYDSESKEEVYVLKATS
jgi:hypothetical protein